MNAIAIFACTFAAIFLFGFVTKGTYRVAFITTFAIGVAYLVIFRYLPVVSLAEIAGYLIGGPIGLVVSMALQRRWQEEGAMRRLERCVMEYVEGQGERRITLMEIVTHAQITGAIDDSREAYARVGAVLRGNGWGRFRDKTGWHFRRLARG